MLLHLGSGGSPRVPGGTPGIPPSALSPGAFDAGGLFGATSSGGGSQHGPLSPASSGAGSLHERYAASWHRFKSATGKLIRKNTFKPGLGTIRKHKVEAFDDCFGSLRLPRTKRNVVKRVLGKKAPGVGMEVSHTHSVRKLTRASQERRRALLRDYKQHKAAARKEIRERVLQDQENERGMRVARRRVLHSRGKVHKASSELSAARRLVKRDVRTDFKQLAAMPSSQVRVKSGAAGRSTKNSGAASSDATATSSTNSKPGRRRTSAYQGSGRSVGAVSPLHGGMAHSKRAGGHRGSVAASVVSSVGSYSKDSADGSSGARSARHQSVSARSVGSVSTSYSDVTQRSGASRLSQASIVTDVTSQGSGGPAPLLRSQSSRRPSLAVVGRDLSSKSIGALGRPRDAPARHPAMVPETSVLVHDDLEHVQLGSVDLPFVRPLITLGSSRSIRSDSTRVKATRAPGDRGTGSVAAPTPSARRGHGRHRHHRRRRRRRKVTAKREQELDDMLQRDMEKLTTEQKLQKLLARQEQMSVERIQGFERHIDRAGPSKSVRRKQQHRALASDARFQCRRRIEEAAALNNGVIPNELEGMLPTMPDGHSVVILKLSKEVHSQRSTPTRGTPLQSPVVIPRRGSRRVRPYERE